MNVSNPVLNKILSTMSELSTGRVAIAGFIITGIYYYSFFDDGSRFNTEITSLKQQIEAETVKKAETVKILKKEEQMRADVSLLVKKYEEVKSKIPIEFLESELRIIIDKLADENNLKTTKNNRGNAGQNLNAFEDAKLVEQVPLEYSFTGSFSGIFNFIKQASLTEKLIKLDQITLQASDKRGQYKMRTKDVIFTATIIGFKQSSYAMQDSKKANVK